MKIEKVYAADVRYGVVTRKMKGVIIVESTTLPLVTAADRQTLDNDTAELPVQGDRPIHQAINQVEHFQQYIADNNLTIDPNQPIEDLRESAEIFFNIPEWEPGITVKVGEQYRYENVLYDVIQAHTTQSDWTPDIVPALFTVAAPTGLIAEWVQPTGAHDAYNTGDKVRFEGDIWESLIDANVWSPTAYPAGWKNLSSTEEPPEEPGENPCEGVKVWDANDHWTTYTVGDRRVDEGKLYECHNTAFSYHKPSGAHGHHGWTYIQDCS